MSARRTSLAVFFLVCVWLQARAERPSLAFLQEYFLPPELSAPALSPTGEYLGCILRKGDDYGVGIYSLAAKELKLLGGTKDRQVFTFWWKGPKRLLIEVSNQKRDGRTLVAIDVDGQNMTDLWRTLEVPGFILDALPDDPRHIVKQNQSEVLLVDITTGAAKALDRDLSGGTFSLLADNNRRFRSAYTNDSDGNQIVKWKAPGVTGAAWQRVAFRPEERGFRPIGFDEDPRYLWVWDEAQGGETVVSKLDTLSGARVVVGRRSGLDPTFALTLGRFHEPLALVYAHTMPLSITPLSDKYAVAVKNFEERFRGFLPLVVDSLPDKRTWIVWAGNSRLPGAYFIFDSLENRSSLIGLSYSAQLTEDKLAPAEQFSMKSRGGQRLRCLLWRPAGVTEPPLLVVCPGELPGTPALDTFDPYIQALVASGIAVAKVDARGTYGYGEPNLAAADGSVAVSLREDLEDFVRIASASHYVDARRVGIFGNGLGGAMALKLAATSDVFSAVVTVNVPSRVTRGSLVNFSREFSTSRTIAQLGGWTQSGRLAEELSPLETGPTLKQPALYLFSTEPHSATRLSEDGRDLKRALEKSGVPAQVGIAYGPGEYPRPPSAVARDRANQIVQIADFLAKAWPSK